MSLDIGTALREGASRTVKRNGLMLIAAFAALGLVNVVVQQSILVGTIEWAESVNPEAAAQQPVAPLALPIPLPAAVLGAFVMAFVAEALHIVAVRVMVSERTETVPGEFVRRNAALAVLNGFVGGIVVGVLVFVGSLFLIVPGIFLWLSFLFLRQRIAVEDENFVEAMVESWELASGNRVELFLLGLALVAVSAAVLLPLFLASSVLQGSPVPPLLQTLVSAPVTVFGVAAISRAYVQLAGGDGPAQEAETGSGSDDEEWPDPPGVDV